MTEKKMSIMKDKRPFVLGVIPARGGSKGIKRKNIKIINGKPLVYWSIKAAQESKLLDKFIISTEDSQIKAVAESFGAEVMDRPCSLARDFSTTLAVLQHILKHNPHVDIIVLLQPTSPVRDGRLIDTCINKFIDSGKDSLATGFMSLQYEWGVNQNTPRQKLTGWFYDDGNVYVHKAKSILNGVWVSKNKCPLVIPKKFNFEIDDEIDFSIAEMLLNKFGRSL